MLFIYSWSYVHGGTKYLGRNSNFSNLLAIWEKKISYVYKLSNPLCLTKKKVHWKVKDEWQIWVKISLNINLYNPFASSMMWYKVNF